MILNTILCVVSKINPVLLIVIIAIPPVFVVQSIPGLRPLIPNAVVLFKLAIVTPLKMQAVLLLVRLPRLAVAVEQQVFAVIFLVVHLIVSIRIVVLMVAVDLAANVLGTGQIVTSAIVSNRPIDPFPFNYIDL